MGLHNLPSPPAEDPKTTLSRKNTTTSTKSAKPVHRVAKRAGSNAGSSSQHDHAAHAGGMDGRHKRVWKACERCRMKKTKCDGEFPCKRCKDDGLVCTAGVRKKMEYKQLPRGYAEVLENTQFALIATVHKLYSMVRNSQQWDLGEPELNDRGQPVIHNIAQKLGCIRPNSDIDLPVHSVFPEDERGMQELAFQLEEQQRLEAEATKEMKEMEAAGCAGQRSDRNDRASSSELEQSDFEADFRAAQYGHGGDDPNANGYGSSMTLSPQSFTTSNSDFEMSQPPPELDSSQAMFPNTSPMVTNFPHAWPMMAKPQQPNGAAHGHAHAHSHGHIPMSFAASPVSPMDLQRHVMLNQGLMDSEFGFIKPHVLNCPNPDVMLGMGDPMIYAGFDTNEMTGL